MSTFSWLHGDNGEPCKRCGSHIDPRIMRQVWDREAREYVHMTFDTCDACRADVFQGRDCGVQVRAPQQSQRS